MPTIDYSPAFAKPVICFLCRKQTSGMLYIVFARNVCGICWNRRNGDHGSLTGAIQAKERELSQPIPF